MSIFSSDLYKTAFDFTNKAAKKKLWQAPNIGQAVSAGVTALSPFITGGNHTALGDIGMGLGTAVSTFNPVVGAAITGVSALGNAAFGSNVNEQAVEDYNRQINNLNTAQFNARSNTDLLNQFASVPTININKNNLGTQGWFSHKIDNTYNNLQNNNVAAMAGLNYKKSLAASNVDKLNDALVSANYAAFGGPLFDFGDGAIAYDMAKDSFIAKQLANQNKNIPQVPNAFGFGGPRFSKGLKFPIYDNGIITIGAGGTHGENPFGGVLMGMAPDGQPNLVEEGEVIYNDYVYSNRLKVPKELRDKYHLKKGTFADAMNHYFKKNGVEERPNDPIMKNGLMAFASDLAMSQEEIKMRKEMKQMGLMADGGHLFAKGSNIGRVGDSYKNAWSDYVMPREEEIFNDYLYQYNMAETPEDKAIVRQAFMDTINGLQESYYGISGYGMGEKNEAIGKHQELFNTLEGNKYFGGREGIPGIDDIIDQSYYTGTTKDRASGEFLPDSQMGHRTALRHFGATGDVDAAANARLAEIAAKMGLDWNPNDKWTFGEGDNARQLYALSLLDNAPATKASTDDLGIQALAQSLFPIGNVDMSRYAATVPEEEVAETLPWKVPAPEAQGGIGDVLSGLSRGAGLFANLYTLAKNKFDPYRPGVINEVGPFNPITASPIGDYVNRYHTDTNYIGNQLAQEAAATRNAIMQSTLPSRIGGLLAADYNAQVARGNAIRDAGIADYETNLKGSEFNRGTNQYNSQLGFNVAQANMQGALQNAAQRMQQRAYNVNYDFQDKMARDQSEGQGISNLVNWIDAYNRNRDSLSMIGAAINSGAIEANDDMKGLLNTLSRGYFLPNVTREGGKLKKKSKK